MDATICVQHKGIKGYDQKGPVDFPQISPPPPQQINKIIITFTFAYSIMALAANVIQFWYGVKIKWTIIFLYMSTCNMCIPNLSWIVNALIDIEY